MLKIIFGFLLILLTGCSQGLRQQGRGLADEGKYNQAIDLYYQEIKNNPESAEAWQELGIAYYKKGDLAKAEDALKQSNNIKPDARTNLFIGLIYEKQEMYDEALAAYRASLSMGPNRATRKEIEGRLDLLISEKVKHEVSQALAMEANINVDTIPANTIGVIDFDNSQLPPDLAPISKGLAEMTAADLSKVYSLRVVDRLKIEAILNELKLSSSKLADAKVGPRLGKLMGSHQLVSGVLTGVGEDEIRLDGSIVNTATNTTSVTGTTEGALKKFFTVEKEFVFKVIDSLGIDLTAEERDAIMKVPTESFLAFLAYSKGLEYRSQGNYLEAANQFEQAVTLDGSFSAARQQMKSANNMVTAGSQSIKQFEVATVGSSESVSSTVESIQSSLLSISGFISDYDLLNIFGKRFELPIFNQFGTVVIRGNIDARP